MGWVFVAKNLGGSEQKGLDSVRNVFLFVCFVLVVVWLMAEVSAGLFAGPADEGRCQGEGVPLGRLPQGTGPGAFRIAKPTDQGPEPNG